MVLLYLNELVNVFNFLSFNFCYYPQEKKALKGLPFKSINSFKMRKFVEC